MDDRALAHRARDQHVGIDWHSLLQQEVRKLFCGAADRAGPDHIPVANPQDAVIGRTPLQGLIEHRVEYPCEVAGREVNDLQHLGHRGLSRQSLVSLGSALGKLALQIGINLIGIG